MNNANNHNICSNVYYNEKYNLVYPLKTLSMHPIIQKINFKVQLLQI